MGSNLSVRVRRIECALSLLGEMGERLRHLQPTMGSLIRSLSRSEQYSSLGFLKDCHRRMEAGEPFPVAWRGSLEAHRSALGREEAELLASLGDVLGVSDLESQLGALDCTRPLLQDRLEQARSHQTSHAKLYRSMGVLGGLALAILLL